MTINSTDQIVFITHADVVIDPNVLVPNWELSNRGIERHGQFNKILSKYNVTRLYCSDERKAINGAEIHAKELSIPYQIHDGLREHDRSSTGFLHPKEYESVAKEFFNSPTESIRGWEKAIDAQKRILQTVDEIAASHNQPGSIAIISHGGVGALLLCALSSILISKDADQPDNGGGNYIRFNIMTRQLLHNWRDISADC